MTQQQANSREALKQTDRTTMADRVVEIVAKSDMPLTAREIAQQCFVLFGGDFETYRKRVGEQAKKKKQRFKSLRVSTVCD